MKKLLLVIITLFITMVSMPLYAAKEISYTQDDRDRLIRMEEAIKGVNYRIDSLEKRMENIENLMYILISAIFAQIIGVVGFVLWDRRTALSPAIAKNKELEEKTHMLEQALKEMAHNDKKISDALRKVGIL
jgi:cytochrome b subunit of formate dehydrogenase